MLSEYSPPWVMSEISLCFQGAQFGTISMWPLSMMVELSVYRMIILRWSKRVSDLIKYK